MLLSRNLLVASALLPLASAAPCAAPGYIVRWTTKVFSSVGWLEGATSVPEQVVVPTDLFDDNNDSIYRVLKARDEFSKLVEIIDKTDDIRKLLDDKDLKITFFAPNNDALDKVIHHQRFTGDKDDDKEKQRREYARQALKYAILPEAIEYKDFGRNSTLATSLHAHDGTIGGARRRIKVESTSFPPWKVTVNNYAVVTEQDIRASNGVIHKIDLPLFLPPDIVDGLFLLPNEFSLTAAGLFKLNLQNGYEFNAWTNPKDGKNDRHGKGTGTTTFFAPTNDAWNQLPQDLLQFLFSPFGESTLRKLLSFHTIPSEVVFSEWQGEGRRRDDKNFNDDDDRDLSFEWDHHFRSGIDQRLPVHVKKTQSAVPGSRQYNVQVQAHGLYARSIDNVAQNGAVHVLDDVLSPRSQEGIDKAQNTKDWEEWQDWLVKWARERKEEDGGDRDRKRD